VKRRSWRVSGGSSRELKAGGCRIELSMVLAEGGCRGGFGEKAPSAGGTSTAQAGDPWTVIRGRGGGLFRKPHAEFWRAGLSGAWREAASPGSQDEFFKNDPPS